MNYGNSPGSDFAVLTDRDVLFYDEEFHNTVIFSGLEPVLGGHFVVLLVGGMTQFGTFNIGRLQGKYI